MSRAWSVRTRNTDKGKIEINLWKKKFDGQFNSPRVFQKKDRLCIVGIYIFQFRAEIFKQLTRSLLLFPFFLCQI